MRTITVKDTSLVEEQGVEFLEKLSDVLVEDINALYDAKMQGDVFLMEVYGDELYSSINVDLQAGEISKDDAEYLRDKYF